MGELRTNPRTNPDFRRVLARSAQKHITANTNSELEFGSGMAIAEAISSIVMICTEVTFPCEKKKPTGHEKRGLSAV